MSVRICYVLMLLAVLPACRDAAPLAATTPAALTRKVTLAAALHTPWVGEVRARHVSGQGFRIAGKVVERRVEVGSVVQRGQVLARLDPSDASLSAAAAQAELRVAEADLDLARAELGRDRALSAKNFIAHSALDVSEARMRVALARVEQARAQAAVASNQAAYAELLAEADGVVMATQLEAGQVVAAGQPVVQLALGAERDVLVAVPESRLSGLSIGSTVDVRLWVGPQRSYRGRVRELAPAADPLTRTYAMKVGLDDADAAVRLGMTAEVLLTEQPPVLLVPLAAVQSDQGKPAVWVVDEISGRVQPRMVETGLLREDGLEIRWGLQTGERIVVAGVHKLSPGLRVLAVEDDPRLPPTALAGVVQR